VRKRLKKKRRSCATCKPHKTGGATRWTDKELQAMKIADRVMRRAYGLPRVFEQFNVAFREAAKAFEQLTKGSRVIKARE
jgi:hypothetical protein